MIIYVLTIFHILNVKPSQYKRHGFFCIPEWNFALWKKEEKEISGIESELGICGCGGSWKIEGYIYLYSGEDGRWERVPVSRSHRDKRVGKCILKNLRNFLKF